MTTDRRITMIAHDYSASNKLAMPISVAVKRQLVAVVKQPKRK